MNKQCMLVQTVSSYKSSLYCKWNSLHLFVSFEVTEMCFSAAEVFMCLVVPAVSPQTCANEFYLNIYLKRPLPDEDPLQHFKGRSIHYQISQMLKACEKDFEDMADTTC